ncbi:NAD(P)H-hydrate dehydratase [Terriglobus aquaticus]|uniref:Bifunctional NAD(P)H-hydrate repair enzyme n=1 Tax=Terriglobus aquaticus TaxID=940139 RepID=A0ABW9KJM5_9BACT|nr:NAD(P)H-hydrate dehydratase [Terriglobus aquaticus]
MQMVTAAEMAAIDTATAEQAGVPFAELMEHAGAAVARFAQRQFRRARRVVVLCGTGNNGGDGFVAARHLARTGLSVDVIVLGDPAKAQGAAAEAYKALQTSRALPFAVGSVEQVRGLRTKLEDADLLIDAVLGTGFKPPLRELPAALRDLLREVRTPVLSVDLPSGWDADLREQSSPDAFRSDAVITFTAPKPAHLFGHLTTGHFGPVVVAPIGTPESLVRSEERLTWTGASTKLLETPRPMDSNKGMYGHVLVVGGAAGKPGAPSMSSLAALRTGAGLVTAAVARSIQQTVALTTPELMTAALDEAEGGALALSNVSPERLETLLKKISVLAVGPGLGTEGETPAMVQRLVAETTLPLVLDADGLNAFKGKAELLDGSKRTLVLTPHPGEMATLLGVSTKQVQADRLNLARKFATEHQLHLVLKGWRTLVAHPDGRVAVNTTGNPGMAKGGSGDILTGIVAAMLAQFPHEVAGAVEAAVYLHGLAADLAVQRRDERTLLATDTIAHLSDALRYRVQDEDGATWICGVRRRGGRWSAEGRAELD